MSPTLLEGLVALILIVVAWQIGLALAPLIFREWRFWRHSLDEISNDIDAELTTKEQQHDPHP